MSGHLDELEPPDLAAVFEAISTGESAGSLEWLSATAGSGGGSAGSERVATRAAAGQERRSVVVPAWWELELMGLVEAWARAANGLT